MNRFIYILAILLIAQVLSYGQTRSAYIEAAEERLINDDYYSALSYYLEAYEFDTTDIVVLHNVAESAREFHAYGIAEKFYQKVLDADEENQYPTDQFWLAHAKQKLGNYNDARVIYRTYLAENEGDNDYFTQRADKEIKACEWAIDEEQNPRPNIEIERLGDGINTQYSEFGSATDEDGLYFSSLRFSELNATQKPPRLISKVLISTDDINTDTLNSELNKDNLFSAHTAFNKDKTRVYFTLCEYHNGANIRCDLFVSDVIGLNQFSPPRKLASPINVDSFTTTQPSYAFNEVTGGERLYFVSDRDGGKGKLDIWYVDISKNGDYSLPMNLPNLNTNENDITPFYHTPSRTLYFSSDGYRTMGGYDIFKSKSNQGVFDKPVHLGAPVNGSYHDVYYTLDESGDKAYFSTNRYGSNFIDIPQEACCYDIYKVDIAEVDLKLNAKTCITPGMDSLLNAKVSLYDADTKELISEVVSPNGIDHFFDLEPDRNYQVIASKMNYTSDTIIFNTNNMYVTDTIEKKMFLTLNMVCLDLSVFDADTKEGLENATIRITDLTDPTAEDIIVTNPDSFRTVIKLDPNKSYRVQIDREGYETQTFIIDENTNKDGGIIKRDIFMPKRDLNIFLPALLYFDNDRPDRKTLEVTTDKTYTDTYEPYMARKNYFINRIARGKGLNVSRQVEIQRMDDFFEFDVKGGYAKLYMFLNELTEKLEQGYGFEILIKGHASPLAPNSYNKNLSQRRISSVRNELAKFRNGILTPYIDAGKLLITDVSYGEEQAGPNISDSPRNPSRSIYSVEASRERRVEIIKIRTIHN